MNTATRGLSLLLLGLSLTTPSLSGAEAPSFAQADRRSRAKEQIGATQRSRRAEAHQFAQAHGIATQGITPAGQTYELQALLGGRMVFNVTTNENVAITGAVDQVRDLSGRSALTGAGLDIGLWDGGTARATHQEFKSGRSSRAILRETVDSGPHATFVAGTLGAAGVDGVAKGMAPAANIHSWDWTGDLSEMTGVAAATANDRDKLTISNHSYGVIAGWQGTTWYGTWGNDEDEIFGQYNAIVAEWDRVTYGAPYYLPFVAAGNDRNDPAPTAGAYFTYFDNGTKLGIYDPTVHPPSDGWDQGGYDTLLSYGVAKNVMTVGAIQGGIVNGQRDPGAVAMTSYSAWGPTDDGRVKPDVVINGSSVRSSYNTADNAYATGSGTSYAAPGAAGAALLLQEQWQRDLNAGAMRASTMKALLVHTADDLGNAGPDFSFGWGLVDTKAASDAIAAHAANPAAGTIRESALLSGSSFQSAMASDGSSEIVVTIAWTDPEGAAQSGLNSRIAVLVNDLDLRVIGPDGTVHLPFALDVEHPSLPALRGDNTVDNVEQVRIASPAAGTYTVRVSHKGALRDGDQVFSMIASGLQASSSGGSVDSGDTTSGGGKGGPKSGGSTDDTTSGGGKGGPKK